MKKLWLLAAAFLVGGVVMLLLPVHVSMTGLVLVLLGAAVALWLLLKDRSRRARILAQVVVILACGGVVTLMACMNIITTSGQTDWKRAEKADYAIVLGAGIREDGSASRIMRNRLVAAQELLERNPDVVVILSGGQGGDEPRTEASCMYETLLQMGADGSRLLLEEDSETTRQNLLNSLAIIQARGGTDPPIALVTSEFHQRRAAYIAKSLDLDTCPVSGHTDQWFYRVNYTLREVFAFVKAAFQSGMD